MEVIGMVLVWSPSYTGSYVNKYMYCSADVHFMVLYLLALRDASSKVYISKSQSGWKINVMQREIRRWNNLNSDNVKDRESAKIWHYERLGKCTEGWEAVTYLGFHGAWGEQWKWPSPTEMTNLKKTSSVYDCTVENVEYICHNISIVSRSGHICCFVVVIPFS